MQTLIDVPPAALPAEATRLLDSDQPLAEGVTFLPHKLHSRWLAGAGAVLLWPLVWLFGRSWGLAVVRWLQDQPDDVSALLLGPFVTPAVLGGALYLSWSVWRSFLERRLLTAGRWRQGLFLTEQFLLLHEDQRCWLIPRSHFEAIQPVHLPITRPRSPSGVRLVYRDVDNRRHERIIHLSDTDKYLRWRRVFNDWTRK